ncbi:hypothetical protein CLAFUW4_02489 [Fulvia fulva]|uniref:Uncharacterized protein n=1 Tax=Passalora fulva TaxID=5499 RepID=A0A9Q8LBB2_PASFU|nr:uncharacterized protein CLAFUR5_02479 [Fulvia fulva]KAK4631548.1 hypothetical protein CLAFUR4_02484 [Fulvia fulva]KAK4633694.1 hypothetical protein CLAFUR0_02488 [Fulvia fulva]UJO13613.1 hypothetical protein CLAFUR5_02479 [Fulvia fulva]WPV10815.1 hypothetical protein CLAFUW4_02489 [Fulvia fulva]WPV26608.1 hypothetical protein CLAFUW7_02489 [Fulvia fulva]
MAQPCHAVVLRDFSQYGQKATLISEHSSVGSANLNAQRCAQDLAGGAQRIEVTYHHFGGYSAYCQTGEVHREPFELEVVRSTRRDASRPSVPPSAGTSNVVNLQGNTSVLFNKSQSIHTGGRHHPGVATGSGLQQQQQPAQPRIPSNGHQVLPHAHTLPPIAPLLQHASQQPTQKATVPIAAPPKSSSLQRPYVAYTLTRVDYDHWEDDAKEETHVLGVFLDLKEANAAARKHTEREYKRAEVDNGCAETPSEDKNYADGVVLECRTYQDDRDHFIVEVKAFQIDMLDDGYEDTESEEEDEDEDEDAGDEDEDGDAGGPPPKKRRF